MRSIKFWNPVALKVLHLSSSAWAEKKGGAQAFVDRLASSLPGENIVIARKLGFGSVAAPPSYILADRGGNSLVRIADLIVKTLRRSLGSNVIFAHYLPHYFVCPFLWGRRDVVFVFHGPAALERAAEGGADITVKFLSLFERVMYRLPRHFVCLSEHFKRILVEFYGVAEARITVIPGIAEAAGAARPLKERFPLLRLVTVRRLVRRAGLDLAVEACALLATQGRHVELTIIGDGPERSRLEELAKRLSAPVVFAGPLPDEQMFLCLNSSDAFILPTRSLEGFGMVLLEALQRHLPVIATPAGAIPETLHTLKLAHFMANEITAEALAQKMTAFLEGRLVADWDKVDALIETHYSQRAVTAQYVDLIKKITNGPI